MLRLLVYASANVGPEMSSAGIRSYEFARALASHFDVTLMAPGGVSGLDTDGFQARSSTDDLGLYDVVIAQSVPWPLARRLRSRRTKLIYDLYTPAVNEHVASLGVLTTGMRRAYARAASQQFRLALHSGDAFVCASERQRDVLLGALTAVGRVTPEAYVADPTFRSLVDVVPFGVPGAPPDSRPTRLAGVGEEDFVLLWAGGIVNWLDPLTPIRAMAEVAPERSQIKLVFLSLRTPDGVLTAKASEAVQLARSLDLIGRSVFFNDSWVAYHDRARYLAGADVGVSAHQEDIEARYAFRTRILDHFWAGLPTITTRGDVLAELISDRRLGVALAPNDVDGWARAIRDLADDVAGRATIRRNVLAVRPEFAWSRVVQPLVRLADLPRSPAATPLVRQRAAAVATRAHVAFFLRAERLRRRFTLW